MGRTRCDTLKTQVGALLSIGILTYVVATPPVLADDRSAGPVERSAPVTPVVFDGDLRDLAPARRWRPGDPIREVPKRYYSPDGPAIPAPPPPGSVPDRLLARQRSAGLGPGRTVAAAILSFPGLGYSGVAPPDTVGEAGPDYYIQATNGGGSTLYRVFDKTGTPVTAPLDLDSLWTGGGECANGYGDPIILYDELASRWLMSEFARDGDNLCVYISQTSDPLAGGWYGYQFTTPNFPDYPKYGVWHDGYYVTTNEGNNPAIYALDRAQMLAGLPATFQRFTVPGLSGFRFQALTPADHDGALPPPAGAPAHLMRHRDDESHGGGAASDFLDIWSLDIDWGTPANSALTQLPSIAVTEFDSALCGLTTLDCVPQPGTGQGLDPLREVLMWRLQYRNRGGYETLVGNYSIDIGDFADHAGIRWFELRRVGAGEWTLFQEGTYSPDATHRWMGSAAMDEAGDIGLAYSLSDDSSVHPSIGFTGRAESDAPGVMTEAETVVVSGDSSQGFDRWGDYSSINVDPEDGCTFWLTNEYMSGGDWETWIATFQLPGCLCASPVQAAGNPSAMAIVDNRIDLAWDDSPSASVTQYRIDRSATPGGPYSPIATLPDSSPGSGGGPPYSYQDSPLSGGMTYYYVIVADDGGGCRTGSTEVEATATGPCLLPPDFDGLVGVTDPADCTLVLSWDPATSNCSGAVTYDVHRDTVAGFTPDPTNRIATGLTATSYVDGTGLRTGTTYHYVVRAVDGTLTDANLAERSGTPGGPPAGTVTFDSADTPIAIPDNDATGIASTIPVASSGPLRGITVDVEIEHERVGNLVLVLESPTGTRVTLLNRPGRPPRAGCADDDMRVTFDDASTFDLDAHCPGTTPWYDGVAAPLEPLQAVLGEPVAGIWRLLVQDRQDNNTGQLISWSLNLTLAAACDGDCDAAAIGPIEQLLAVRQAGDVRFSWVADLAAGDYNLRWVDDKRAIPAREGNGSDVCIALVWPPGPCLDLDAVAPDGVLRYYNVIGACRGTEAIE